MSNCALLGSNYGIPMRIKDAIRELAGHLFLFLNLPGFVKPIEYADKFTGDYIRIRVGKWFTIISINNRDYWFRRITGKFDGTGYAMCVPISEQLDCILGDTPESTHPLSVWGRLKLLLQSIGWGCWL